MQATVLTTRQTKVQTPLLGLCLLILMLLCSVFTDAACKDLVADYPSLQLIFISAMVLVGSGLAYGMMGHQKTIFQTATPKLMLLRALMSVAATVCFYAAFYQLPFAEVFLFIGGMPIISALLSAVLLKEPVSSGTWLALGFGFFGLILAGATHAAALGPGHIFGLCAAILGSVSTVLSRMISRNNTTALAQVFYCQVASLVIAGVALPFVWVPIHVKDMPLLILSIASLFAVRWLLVLVLRIFPAHLVMQSTSFQFAFMVIVGQVIFHETIERSVWIGAFMVIGASISLGIGHAQRNATQATAVLAAKPAT